jgi:hypothetical protein
MGYSGRGRTGGQKENRRDHASLGQRGALTEDLAGQEDEEFGPEEIIESEEPCEDGSQEAEGEPDADAGME